MERRYGRSELTLWNPCGIRIEGRRPWSPWSVRTLDMNPDRRAAKKHRTAFVLLMAGLLAVMSRARASDVTVDQEIRKLAQEAPLRLRFQGKTAKEALAWQD